MNILIISPNIPYPMAGFSTRNFHILKALASRHTVSLFALKDDIPALQRNMSVLENMTHEIKIIPHARVLPKRWEQLLFILRGKPYILNEYHVEEMQIAVDQAIASNNYDLVLFESSLVAGYHLPPNIPIIIDQHNLEYEILLRTSEHEKAWLRKSYNRIEGRRLKPIEIERCRRASAILVTSERERLALKHLLPESVVRTVPNGVDCSVFQIQDTYQEIENSIVFTGAMDYYPNVDAVNFFARHCWPLIKARIPSATWQIVGKNPLPDVLQLARLPGVTVTGTVPETQSYLASASIAIAPLRIGSGTRLKILEAFAMGKAVVSTSIGCEGLAVEAGRHLLIANQPGEFAEAVIKLLEQSEKRRELGDAGQKLVETTYDWEQCGKALLQLIEETEPSLHG